MMENDIRGGICQANTNKQKLKINTWKIMIKIKNCYI